MELEFANDVFPTSVEIYEIFNGGSVVAVKLFNAIANDWTIAWQCTSQHFYHVFQSQIFSPPLKAERCKTNRIRLEMDGTNANDNCGIDAVRLIGWTTNETTSKQSLEQSSSKVMQSAMHIRFYNNEFKPARIMSLDNVPDHITVCNLRFLIEEQWHDLKNEFYEIFVKGLNFSIGWKQNQASLKSLNITPLFIPVANGFDEMKDSRFEMVIKKGKSILVAFHLQSNVLKKEYVVFEPMDTFATVILHVWSACFPNSDTNERLFSLPEICKICKFDFSHVDSRTQTKNPIPIDSIYDKLCTYVECEAVSLEVIRNNSWLRNQRNMQSDNLISKITSSLSANIACIVSISNHTEFHLRYNGSYCWSGWEKEKTDIIPRWTHNIAGLFQKTASSVYGASGVVSFNFSIYQLNIYYSLPHASSSNNAYYVDILIQNTPCNSSLYWEMNDKPKSYAYEKSLSQTFHNKWHVKATMGPLGIDELHIELFASLLKLQ